MRHNMHHILKLKIYAKKTPIIRNDIEHKRTQKNIKEHKITQNIFLSFEEMAFMQSFANGLPYYKKNIKLYILNYMCASQG